MRVVVGGVAAAAAVVVALNVWLAWMALRELLRCVLVVMTVAAFG
jgi:hypothetical protein